MLTIEPAVSSEQQATTALLLELDILKRKIDLFYEEEIVLRGDKNLIQSHAQIFGTKDVDLSFTKIYIL